MRLGRRTYEGVSQQIFRQGRISLWLNSHITAPFACPVMSASEFYGDHGAHPPEKTEQLA
ncbi:MAG: hypothetical protein C3F02_02160 [Parcubacteria group bacterium]|nr:MAG: hypothetical protein C3F02_02160 [Parcubacteria group bacterium]